MREIKFRAWDKGLKKIWYQTKEHSIWVGGYGINIIGDDLADEHNKHILLDISYAMQYTGLKDKNGKEIYEGDIIERTSHNPYFRGQIKWGGEWEVCGFSIVGIKPWANGRVEFSRDQLNKRWEDKYIEVIGNIYENPELLTKE